MPRRGSREENGSENVITHRALVTGNFFVCFFDSLLVPPIPDMRQETLPLGAERPPRAEVGVSVWRR